MNSLPYKEDSKESIKEYSLKLINKTFKEVLDSDSNIDELEKSMLYTIYNNPHSKGGLGNLIEEHFFFYKPNSNS